jgi:hypothetical protein|tara:strand:- start:89 stop:325 length:237 start_codon:yes stop_codon:yes gene_type:complete
VLNEHNGERRADYQQLMPTIARIDANVKILTEGKKDHEGRIRGLEKAKNHRDGALGVIVAGFSLTIGWIVRNMQNAGG